ncbi:MAG: ATP-binding cassette domain-containing protein [Vicinamibacterales bacterium]
MSLVVEVTHTVGRFHLDVRLQSGAGLTALVGPSGAGKTTILNAVAGVLRPDRGLVRLDREVLVDTEAGTWRASHRRLVGYVFQEPRLFPHLTVRQNLLYGRWFRRHLAGGISPDEVIELLNLSPLLARRPARLSGGEKQRVALGRALLAKPRLLLLDEPLASVDQTHRNEILPYLDRLRAAHDIPAVYVTHTWAEVAERATQVVEIDHGKVVFCGSALEARSRMNVGR